MKQITLTLSILMTIATAQAAGWESLIQNLTQSRAELEGLSKDMDSLQKEKQADLDQWSQRRTDLDGQVQREKLRELQLAEKIKRVDSRVRSQAKSDPNAQKKVLGWIGDAEAWVNKSLPFQQEQRLSVLKGLKDRASSGHESMEFVLADLWMFMESEMKLSQSSEFTIMDITLEGKTKKAEIARLGLRSLFAVTPDGKILQMKKKNSGWTWVPVENNDEESSIQLLVKNLKTKNFSGYYLLPVDNTAQMGAGL